MTQGSRETGGHLRGLVLPRQEPAHGHRRNPCCHSESAVVQDLLGHVRGHEVGVVSDDWSSHHGNDNTPVVPTVSTHFLTESISPEFGQLPSLCVPKRPTLESPTFGAWLKKRRGKRSHAEVANQIRDRVKDSGLKVPPSLIVKIEQGRIPNWPVLAAIGEVFKEPFDQLVLRLARSMQFRGGNAMSIAVPDFVGRDVLGNDRTEIDTADGRREFVPVPVLSGRIAAGPPLVVDERDIADYAAFSPALLTQLGVTTPYCVRVGRYERSMLPTIRPGDTVLLDCSEARRENPRKDRIYAVNVEEGSTLKRVVVAGGTLMLISDNLDKDEYPVRTIEWDGDTELRSIIVGEAVWCGTSL